MSASAPVPRTPTDTHIVRLPLSWPTIQRVREATAKAAASYPDDLREAAIMVATELTENVIKYGELGDQGMEGLLRVSAGRQEVRVESNNAADAARAEAVRRIVESLQSCESPEQLYIARLREIVRDPSLPTSNLGLLRIAYEGGFTLSCDYDGRNLTVLATRRATDESL